VNLKKLIQKAVPVLKGIAPAAAAAASGPYAPIVFTAVRRLLGQTEGTDEDLLGQIAQARPEDLVRVRELDANVELERERLGITREQMYLHDVQDARDRQAKTMDNTPRDLTYLAYLIFFGTVALVIIKIDIFTANSIAANLAFMILGAAISWVTQGNNFHLGSSRGSFNKTQSMANQASEWLSTIQDLVPKREPQ